MGEMLPRCIYTRFKIWDLSHKYSRESSELIKIIHYKLLAIFVAAPLGHRVLLTLGEDFELEQSSGCRFDALEVRDGPFGWSPAVVERLCGTNGRGVRIMSSGRALWLRFVSDVSLEARGFQSTYKFVNSSGEFLFTNKWHNLKNVIKFFPFI